LLGILLIIIGLEGIAFAPSILMLRVAIALIGFGGGIVNGGTNAPVADISSEGKGAGLNLLGVFFGVGAVGTPFVLAAFGARFESSTLVAALGVLVLLPFAFIASNPFPVPKHPQGFPIAEAGKLTRDPLLLLMGFMLFLESGMEIMVGGWTTTFVNEILAVSPRTSLIVLSLYWLGMMLARLALGTFLRNLKPTRVLYSCIAIGILASVMLLSTENLAVACLGVFCLGVGFAAAFPMILGFVGDRYAGISGTAFSLAI